MLTGQSTETLITEVAIRGVHIFIYNYECNGLSSPFGIDREKLDVIGSRYFMCLLHAEQCRSAAWILDTMSMNRFIALNRYLHLTDKEGGI